MDCVIRFAGDRFVGVVDSVWLRSVRANHPTHQHSVYVHLEKVREVDEKTEIPGLEKEVSTAHQT